MNVGEWIVLLFVPGRWPERLPRPRRRSRTQSFLEDGLGPDDKHTPRENLSVSFTRQPVIVWINAVGAPWHKADVDAAAKLGPAAVMVPKSERGAALTALADMLAAAKCPLVAVVDTALRLSSACEIATIATVSRWAFGSIDYCVDLGIAHTPKVAFRSQRTGCRGAPRRAGDAARRRDHVNRRRRAGRDDACYARSRGLGRKLAP